MPSLLHQAAGLPYSMSFVGTETQELEANIPPPRIIKVTEENINYPSLTRQAQAAGFKNLYQYVKAGRVPSLAIEGETLPVIPVPTEPPYYPPVPPDYPSINGNGNGELPIERFDYIPPPIGGGTGGTGLGSDTRLAEGREEVERIEVKESLTDTPEKLVMIFIAGFLLYSFLK